MPTALTADRLRSLLRATAAALDALVAWRRA